MTQTDSLLLRTGMQMTLADESDEYRAFEEKFKPKKTTDDCYTPKPVYDAVLAWVVKEYGVDAGKVMRPFKPGGDYQREEYPVGCAVVDNPPFSMLSEICRWYDANDVQYFLFAPSLTLFSVRAKCCRICSHGEITYENGAKVATSFVTNMDTDNEFRTAPELTLAINKASDDFAKQGKTELPKYVYPYDIATAARICWMDKYGAEFAVRRGDCCRISGMDEQKAYGKGIFGGGYLLSERAAAERAAAERAAAERAAAERAAAKKWQLSDRERKMQAMLGRADD